MLPLAALAADSDFTMDNGVLTKYNGPGGDVVIPDGVTSIGDWAFSNCFGLTGVVIPDGVTSIGQSAFFGCSSLTSVTIPDGVTSIGTSAFNGCTKLVSVTIPNSVTSIGSSAFNGCSNLTSIAIPDQVTTISTGMFFGCANLTNVILPSGVTSIEMYAFGDCKSLTDVYYGGSEAQWQAITVGALNECLADATLHCSANIAYPSTMEVDVDGAKVTFQCYALKEGAGLTNYIKLRDFADIMNGSAAQFEVGWDGNITITTGTAYTKNGTEQNTPFSGQRPYERPAVSTLVNGETAELDTFQLKDDNGGGYTYYKLRDLGTALGITVDWDTGRGVFIETK